MLQAHRRSARQVHRDLFLGLGRPRVHAVGSDEMHRVAIAAHHAGCRRNVIRHDPVAALALELFARVLDDMLGLGREADDQRRPVWFPGARSSPGCRGSRRMRVPASCRRPVLDLLVGRARDAPVGDSGGKDRRRLPEALLPRRPACRARFRLCIVVTPTGSGIATGPDTSVTSAPAAAAAAAIAWPCFPDERLAM